MVRMRKVGVDVVEDVVDRCCCTESQMYLSVYIHIILYPKHLTHYSDFTSG